LLEKIHTSITRGKIDFAEIFKNFARYRSENNFIKLSKLYRTFKLVARISKFFATLLIMFEFS